MDLLLEIKQAPTRRLAIEMGNGRITNLLRLHYEFTQLAAGMTKIGMSKGLVAGHGLMHYEFMADKRRTRA
jgi:hypothetical protein